MPEFTTSEQTIFLAALERSSATDRAAYLDEACAGRPELRADVESLLAAHERLPTAGAPLDTADLFLPAGTVIGRYKILEPVGEGGYGTVFLAEQIMPVQRKVALKIIKAGMDTRQVIARFEAERQALALMDHPNIARVFDAGVTDAGRPFFVMELVKGLPITKYCDELKLPPRQRLELFVQVCQAVQHAHQKGIIHRDLKPSNVLIAHYDGKPVPKVIDFGVAKATGQQLTELTMFTGFGDVIGTPQYMSPEQAEVNQLDVDTRSDIYSLGVLLYELLTGTTPLEAKRVKEAALLEVLRVIREEEPPRPSTRLTATAGLPSIAAQRGLELKHLTKMVHGDLDWIVMKALEKDRNRRYETANGFAMDVRRHLADEPVVAGPPSQMYRCRKFVRRNKASLAVTGIVLAALVISIAVLAVSNRRIIASERVAMTEATKAKATADLLEEMLGSANPMSSLGNPKSVHNPDYTVRELLDDFSAGMARQLKDQPEVEVAIRSTIGKAYWGLGINDSALHHLRIALDLARNTFGPDQPALAECLVNSSYALGADHAAEGERLAREALAICRRGAAPPETTLHALRALQQNLNHQKKWAESEAIGDEAIVYAGQFADRQFPEVANILHTLADVHLAQRQYDQAEVRARQAVAMHRRLHGPEHPETAWALLFLGQALHGQNKLGEAETALREALAIFHRYYGVDDQAIVHAFGALSAVLKAQGDGAALAALEHDLFKDQKLALDAHKQALAGLVPEEVTQRERIAEACFLLAQALGNHEDAETGYRLVVSALQPTVSEHATANNLRLLGESLNNLARRCYRRKQYEEAVGLLTQAIQLLEHGEANFPKAAIELRRVRGDSLRLITANLDSLGKLDDAIVAGRKAIELRPDDGWANNNLSVALGLKGLVDEAIPACRKAIELLPHDGLPRRNLGWLLSEKGLLDEAISAFRNGIDFWPDDSWAYNLLGLALQRQGSIDEAIAAFRKSIELQPNIVQVHINLGGALQQKGLLEEASAAYRQAIRIRPSDATSHNALAWHHATFPDPALRDPVRAVEHATTAVELAPDNGKNWNTLGVAQYRAGEWKAAIESLEKAMAMSEGGDGFSWFFLAMAHWQLGRTQEAREWYGKAVEWMQKNHPTDDELIRFRSEAAELLGVNEAE